MTNDFLTLLKEVDNFTHTENFGSAYKSTRNSCLDAFGSLGAMRNSNADYILRYFYRALNEDNTTAKRMLFYLRDVRGGLGERRSFRIILRKMAFTDKEFVVNNLENILFFGRGDDFLCLMDTPCEKEMIHFCKKVLIDDIKSVKKGGSCSLLAKWMPSENTSSKITIGYAKRFMEEMKFSPRKYRKLLSRLRAACSIVETKMSQNKWEEIDFSKLPARASMIYSDAFFKHEEKRYMDYMKSVANGDASINANVLFPVDIVERVLNYSRKSSAKERILTDILWKALPNYFGDKEETGICVIDTSGSMCGKPLAVALSLGLYCADKCKGPYKDHFITFSASPELQEIKGEMLEDKIHNMSTADWDMNTNIEAVFHLILKTALTYNLKSEDLPSKLYIISDMQFDDCVWSNCSRSTGWIDYYYNRGKYKTDASVIEKLKEEFESYGYVFPSIVFWNVRASECGMFQMKDTDNCAMVSGYSASLFKAVIEGTTYEEEIKEDGSKVVRQKLDPITVMRNTLYNERYDRVVI